MGSPLLHVHASWADLPDGVEVSDTWLWFNLRFLIDDTAFETMLRHFADTDAFPAAQILDTLHLACEALTRNGAAALRCGPAEVQWARRMGLATFGAALRSDAQTSAQQSLAVIRCLLAHLTDGEREIAMLALPRSDSLRNSGADEALAQTLNALPDIKLKRLLSRCRERALAASAPEVSP